MLTLKHFCDLILFAVFRVENYVILWIILVQEANVYVMFHSCPLKSSLSYLTSECFVTGLSYKFNILLNKKLQAVCSYCSQLFILYSQLFILYSQVFLMRERA